MTPDELDDRFRPLAKQLHENHMQRLGISDTMRLASFYNQAKYGPLDDWRRSLFEFEFPSLVHENGPLTRPPLEMRDGWAIDSSMSLPHLDRVLEDSEKIIASRRGVRTSGQGAYRSYFQDLWRPDDALEFPSFVDFATSSDLLATVSRYLQSVPVLTTTLPSGIRFVESNAEFDDQPDMPHDSQLYHIEYYSQPNVYVLVLLRDTTLRNGPWTFVPKGSSQAARGALGYWQRGKGYRVSDEELYSVVDRSEVIEFSSPRGTVLFIESSGCFHYGSRASVEPRFQLMYGFSGVCRTDFSEVFMTPRQLPVGAGDSFLRKLVLDRRLAPPGQSETIAREPLRTLLDVHRILSESDDAAADFLVSCLPAKIPGGRPSMS
jgi:hypothetical protein